ncbi:hypothetical protein IF2G_03175 [Cordyceps javanica]|nr:hypothetical protein IF2G_03175 [Cordyceps javanica]
MRSIDWFLQYLGASLPGREAYLHASVANCQIAECGVHGHVWIFPQYNAWFDKVLVCAIMRLATKALSLA